MSERLRNRFLTVSPSDVLEVVGALEEASIDAVVVGGWGVDALLGTQTRRHTDLDIVVKGDDGTRPRTQFVLERLGYRHVGRPPAVAPLLPVCEVFRDDAGRSVDVIVKDLTEFGADAITEGRIDHRPVKCASPAVQLRLHAEYAPSRFDRHDVIALCRRFGLRPPGAYT